VKPSGASLFIQRSIPVWSNYRPAGHMWSAAAFSVARGSIKETSSNLNFVEKRVRLHLFL